MKLTVSDFSHDDYERLCALVAAAEASPDELVRFNRHHDKCPACQRKLIEYGLLAVALLDSGSTEDAEIGLSTQETDSLSTNLYATGSGLVERIQRKSSGNSSISMRSDESTGPRHRKLFLPRWMQAVGITAGVLIAVGTLWWRSLHRAPQADGQKATKSASVGKSPIGVPSLGGRVASSGTESQDIARLKHEPIEGATRLREATRMLSELKGERDQLLDDLEDAKTKQALAQQMVTDLENARQQTSGGLASAQAELATLSDKIRSQDALLAVDAEIHNVLGDPDLQVLDVQTVNVRGQLEHAFGRVFFAPRKALVVYAFDLNQRSGARPGDRFEVWGNQGQQTAGGYRLGALEIDQKDQNRWILKCEDETVLSHIDTVYVTVVGAGRLPATKPLLRAYLFADAGLGR